MGDNEVQLNKSDEQKVTTATIQPLPTQPTMATMDIENEAAVRLFLSESSGVEVGKAIEVWGRLANLGHADAMAWLAYCYSNGCLLIDKHISKDLYIKSAGLGNNYSLGVRNAKDSKKSLEYFNKCVEESDVRALNSVGDYYSNGVEKNYKLAFDYFKMSADKGNAVAICNLGVCFQKGYGVEKKISIHPSNIIKYLQIKEMFMLFTFLVFVMKMVLVLKKIPIYQKNILKYVFVKVFQMKIGIMSKIYLIIDLKV